LLPKDRFVFRLEQAEDAGVDGSLELLIDSRSTNLRSQVQLKSTDSQDTNLDGSISLQVAVANLNYLLNGLSPLYVLFIAQRSELRFAWARDEQLRIEKINPEWIGQGSVTIRFRNLLTEQTPAQIHERIRQEAQIQRQILKTLEDASATEQIRISINPESLRITNPEEAKRTLIESGTAIVTAGYVDDVKNLLKLLNSRDARLPRILLVQAHAEYVSGRYQAAHAAVAEAMLRIEELSDDDRQFLKMLRDGCDYQAGRIDISGLNTRLRSAAEGSARFALSYRLNELRYRVLSERDLILRLESLKALRSFVDRVSRSEDLSEAFRMHSRIVQMELEVSQVPLDSLNEMGAAKIRSVLGRPPGFEPISTAQKRADFRSGPGYSPTSARGSEARAPSPLS
jgi:hypothetical protein